MTTKNLLRAGRLGRIGGMVLLGSALATACQRQPPPPPTDSKSIQQHSEELKKQHKREMENRP